jgi:hypothetical protein
MDLNLLTRDADDLIRKVVSRYNQLYVPTGKFSQLELDLMLDDLRKLYDTFKTIGHLHLTLQNETVKQEVLVNTRVTSASTYEASAQPAPAEKPYQAPESTSTFLQPEPQPEAENDAELEAEPELITEPEVETPTAGFEEKAAPVAEVPVYEPVPEKPAPSEPVLAYTEKPVRETTVDMTTVQETEPAASMLADKFSSGSKSLSETIASSQAPGVMGSRLLFQPISDLSSGIGLNDKFRFINELFANNPTQYEEAITRINKAVNVDEASWILQKYHTTDWAQKAETLSRLKDFIKRRFI